MCTHKVVRLNAITYRSWGFTTKRAIMNLWWKLNSSETLEYFTVIISRCNTAAPWWWEETKQRVETCVTHVFSEEAPVVSLLAFSFFYPLLLQLLYVRLSLRPSNGNTYKARTGRGSRVGLKARPSSVTCMQITSYNLTCCSTAWINDTSHYSHSIIINYCKSLIISCSIYFTIQQARILILAVTSILHWPVINAPPAAVYV